jgi:hypothetical protein
LFLTPVVFYVGPAAIADAIKNMGSLTKFDISMNKLYAAGATALAEGLKGNRVMTELNLAGNAMGKDSGLFNAKSNMSGVTALADVLPSMGAMTRLDARKNCIDDEGKRALQQAGGSRWGT